jgi:hypothetical protein
MTANPVTPPWSGDTTPGQGPAATPKRRNKSKAIGTSVESAVVRYLQDNGWPSAERRSLKGIQDQGDVTGTPGICWEIKGGHAAENASDGQITAWLDETERERVNARAGIGILVVKRKGVSAANSGRWWAILRIWQLSELYRNAGPLGQADGFAPVRLHLADAVTLLRAAGYGDQLGGAA